MYNVLTYKNKHTKASVSHSQRNRRRYYSALIARCVSHSVISYYWMTNRKW